MSESPQKSGSEWRNPQAVAPIVAAVCTVVVAIVGLLSNQMRSNQPPVATVVITAVITQIPDVSVTQVAAESTLVPTSDVAPSTESAPPVTTGAASAPNVTLFYDEDTFTVFNPSDSNVSIEDVTFRSGGEEWDMTVWGNLGDAIPPQQCIRLRDIAEQSQEPPSSCPEEFYGFFKVGSEEVYWRDVTQFEVVQEDVVIATCQMAAGSCAFYVEQ